MCRIALLLIAAMSLSAQESAVGMRLYALAPMGDLRDLTGGQLGGGASVFVSIPVGGGLVLRPTAGALLVPKGDTKGLTGTKTSIGSVDLMVEGLWFPDEDPERGAYLVGAIGLQQWRVSAIGTTPSTRSSSRMGASVGLGYLFGAHLGFEARGIWSPVEKNLTATGVALGMTMKF